MRVKKQLLGATMGVLALTAMSTQAITLDLTTAGSSGTINGAFFQQTDPQSTGTGVIMPFVRVQATGTEEGYNTDLAPMPDVKTGTWTHDITLGEIPVVNVNGVDYYQFLLDINQNSGGDNELLSLYELEIWLKDGALTEANSYDDLAAGGAVKVYDLDGAGDSTIEMDYSLNSGSGSGDMFAYIPVSALGTDGSKNLYLYSAFGVPHTSNDGFEEWAVIGQSTPTVPDAASSMMLFGMALVGLGAMRRKLS